MTRATDDIIINALRSAYEHLDADAPPGPEWASIPRSAATGDSTRRTLTVVAAAVAVIVIGTAGWLARSWLGDDQSPPSSSTEDEIDFEDAFLLELPGRFVVSHLYSTVIGYAHPESHVTVNGEDAEVGTDGRFEHDLTLTLGENVINVTVIGGGAQIDASVEVVALANVETISAFITDPDGTMGIEPVVLLDTDGDPVPPPTQTLLSGEAYDYEGIPQTATDTTPVELRLDPPVVYLAIHQEGDRKWFFNVDRTYLRDNWRPDKPYWITTHDGVIIQISEAIPPPSDGPIPRLSLEITDTQPAWGSIDALFLRNASSRPIDIGSWTIRSRGFEQGLTFPEGTAIPADGSIAVYQQVDRLGERCQPDTARAFFTCNALGQDTVTGDYLFPIPIIQVLDQQGVVILESRP